MTAAAFVRSVVSRETVGEVLDELRLAYRIRITADDLAPTVRVWWRELQGLPDGAVRAAARRHIAREKQFPRVAEIRLGAEEYVARSSPECDQREEDPDVCGVCGARYTEREVTRNRVSVVKLPGGQVRYVDTFTADGEPDLTGKGQHIRETVVIPGYAEITHDRVKHGLPL